MITSFPRRRARRVLPYVLIVVILLLVTIDVLGTLFPESKNHDDAEERPLHEVLPSLYISVYRSQSNPTISEEWRLSLVNLVQYLGVEKTFVSLVEQKRNGDSTSAHAERDIEMLSSDFDRIGGRLDIKRVDPWHKNLPKTTALSPRERALMEQASEAVWEAETRNLGLVSMTELALQGIRFEKILFLDELLFSVCILFA